MDGVDRTGVLAIFLELFSTSKATGKRLTWSLLVLASGAKIGGTVPSPESLAREAELPLRTRLLLG